MTFKAHALCNEVVWGSLGLRPTTWAHSLFRGFRFRGFIVSWTIVVTVMAGDGDGARSAY